jgi:2'-5' RNA ligase
MSNTTRTFVAVEVPQGIAEKLERLQRELAPEAIGVRWIAPQQLHITLAFLGDVAHRDLSQVCEAVGQAVLSYTPFDLTLQGLGAFPTPKKPRNLWVGATGPGAEAMIALQRAVAQAIHRVGYPPDDKRFHPHVTLGRIKPFRSPPLNAEPLIQRHQSWIGGSFRVAEVITFSSTLTPEGPLYAALARARLGGTPNRQRTES